MSTLTAARYDEDSSTDGHLEFWNTFERTVAELHRSLDPQHVAATAACDGRVLLGCDRVSIAVRRGRRAVITAVSGQDRVQRRSNLVRSMSLLASKVIAAGEAVVYRGRTESLPAQIEQPLIDYVQQSGSRMVQVIPLEQPEPPLNRHRPHTKQRATPFGAIIIEHSSENGLSPIVRERAECFAGHVGTALFNALAHERIFLLPLWRLLGECFGWFQGRNLLKFAAAVVLLAGTVSGLAYVPHAYRVEGTGQLMPVVQRQVFAPWDGEVTEIAVASGQRVSRNQKLLELRNDDLNSQLLSLRSSLDEKRQLLSALQAEIDEANQQSTREGAVRLRGRIAQTNIEIQGLTARIAALEQQMALLTVRSPIDGTVATFQLAQRLMNRPVRRGDVLLEIMDADDDWQLEIEIPEHRMGHVLAAQRALATAPLPVEFVLATAPEVTFQGVVKETATRTGLSIADGPTVAFTVAVDKDVVADRRIGAEVRAKIDCGRRSLAYVLFGDVVEFVQRTFW